jgi:hypothetical protein
MQMAEWEGPRKATVSSWCCFVGCLVCVRLWLVFLCGVVGGGGCGCGLVVVCYVLFVVVLFCVVCVVLWCGWWWWLVAVSSPFFCVLCALFGGVGCCVGWGRGGRERDAST